MKKWSLVMGIGVIVLISGTAFCCPAEEVKKTGETTRESADANRPSEMPKEMIDRMLSNIREKDPNKAKELDAIRDKDPAKFREELRKILRERMPTRMGDVMEPGMGPNMGMPGGPGRGEGDRQGGPPGRPGEPGQGDRSRAFKQMSDDFVKWIKENYPDEYKKLEDLKNNQELYDRQMRLLGRKYGWLYYQIQQNPKLGAVLKEDMELSKERDIILRKIEESKNDADKESLKVQLEKVISERYDLLIKRTQIEYEQLSQRIEELKKQVEENKTNVEKWGNPEYKRKKVKEQVERILKEKDEPFPRWE
jgi:hypothetical protein